MINNLLNVINLGKNVLVGAPFIILSIAFLVLFIVYIVKKDTFLMKSFWAMNCFSCFIITLIIGINAIVTV